jgi:type III secretion system chaperone SycN
MSGPETTLRQFGEEAGMPGLGLDARGHAVLQTESGRQLGIEAAGNEVLVHVSQEVDYDAGAWLMRAWKRAHHTHLDEWPVQAALREHEGRQRLLALTRIPEPEFTLPRLRQAFDYLSRWLDAVRDDSH